MKKYLVVMDKDEQGRNVLRRTNDGFSPIELLGLCSLLQFEIVEQMRGAMRPDEVKREVVEGSLK